MTEQRAPIDRVVDAMVAAPLAYMQATREATSLGLSAIEYVLGNFATRVVDYRARSTRSTVPPRPVANRRAATPDPERLQVTSPRPVGEASSKPASAVDAVELLPIEGYDQLTGRQIVAAIDDLTIADLEAILVFESGQKQRQTVLRAIDRALQAGGR